MGARKAAEQHIRNITKNSTGTYQLSIPKKMVGQLKWKQGQKVEFKLSGDTLVIENWNK